MINTTMINEKIKTSGLKKKAIASYLDITQYALSQKINNEREFKVSEVCKLIELLKLNQEEVFCIFFSKILN